MNNGDTRHSTCKRNSSTFETSSTCSKPIHQGHHKVIGEVSLWPIGTQMPWTCPQEELGQGSWELKTSHQEGVNTNHECQIKDGKEMPHLRGEGKSFVTAVKNQDI
jgi:hypothetical protein